MTIFQGLLRAVTDPKWHAPVLVFEIPDAISNMIDIKTTFKYVWYQNYFFFGRNLLLDSNPHRKSFIIITTDIAEKLLYKEFQKLSFEKVNENLLKEFGRNLLPDSERPVGVITEIRARSEFGSRSYPRSHPQVFLIFWPFLSAFDHSSLHIWSFIVISLQDIVTLAQYLIWYKHINCVKYGMVCTMAKVMAIKELEGGAGREGSCDTSCHSESNVFFTQRATYSQCFSLKMLICLTSFRPSSRLFCQRHYSLGLALVLPSSDPSVRATLLEQFSLFSPLLS